MTSWRGGEEQPETDASSVLSLFWGRGYVTWPSEKRKQGGHGAAVRRCDWLDNGQVQQEERLPGDGATKWAEPRRLSSDSDGLFGFQITTSTGSELLLQVDNYSTALKWYDAIKTAIHASVSSASFPPLLSGCWFRLSSSPLCYRPEPTEVLLCGGPTAPSTCPGTAPYRDGALPPRAPSSGTRSTGAPSVSTSSRTSLQITAFNYSVKLQCLNCSVKLQQ